MEITKINFNGVDYEITDTQARDIATMLQAQVSDISDDWFMREIDQLNKHRDILGESLDALFNEED